MHVLDLHYLWKTTPVPLHLRPGGVMGFNHKLRVTLWRRWSAVEHTTKERRKLGSYARLSMFTRWKQIYQLINRSLWWASITYQGVNALHLSMGEYPSSVRLPAPPLAPQTASSTPIYFKTDTRKDFLTMSINFEVELLSSLNTILF